MKSFLLSLAFIVGCSSNSMDSRSHYIAIENVTVLSMGKSILGLTKRV